VSEKIIEHPLAAAKLPSRGRVLAIDLGEKRIGIALSDPTQTLASAHDMILRTSRKADYAAYQELVDAHDAVFIIMGLPLSLSGGDSNTTRWVRDYSAELAENVTVPVAFWDETYSTMQAETSLRERGVRGEKLKEQIDAVAAAFILQDFLDARSSYRRRIAAEQEE
jgi:putative Holliday junction resolvase